MPNVIRVVIEGTGERDVISGLRRIDQQADRVDHSLTEAGRAAQRMGQQGERAGHEVQQSMERAAEATQDVGDSAEGSGGMLGALGEQASGSMDNLIGGAGKAGEMLGALGPYGKAAGVAIGAGMMAAGLAVKTFMDLVTKASQRTADLSQSKAVLGITGADAARFGKVAGQVYVDNWGESIKDAGETVRNAALYIMPTASDMGTAITPSLRVVSERVAALADTMGEDSKRVSVAIRQMLVTGMASSVDEAFNLLHAGISKGVDGADDLLDTFIEYSTQFRQLGLNGKQAMTLLSQGLQGGARDADTVADGLKEIAILAQEVGNATVTDAFKKLGLNQKQLGADFAAGGDRASKALGMILDKLRAIKDPAQQNAMAIALFGTKAEDLQDALFNLDLSGVAAEFGDVSGAADQAAATLSAAPMATVDAYRRKWEMFQADMGDKLVPTFLHFIEAAERFAHEVAPTVHKMLDAIAKKWDENREGIEQFGELMEIVLGATGQAVIGAIYMSIMTLLDAINLIGVGWSNVKVAVAIFGDFFLNALGTFIHGAATAFGWIPGIGPKLKNAAKEFDDFAARANIALEGIRDQDVHVRVQVDRSGYAPVTAAGAGSPSTHRFSAAGGAGGALLTMVNDGGPELIDWQAGRVHNFQETKRMMSGAGASGATPSVALVFRDGGRGGASDIVRDWIADGVIELTADLETGRVSVA